MSVKLDSLSTVAIDLELTDQHTQSLYRRVRQAVYVADDEPAADVAVRTVFEILREWAEQVEGGCCSSCEGQGHVGPEACTDCLGTGHAHAPNSVCPNQVVGDDEGWMQAHKRGVEMRDEAQQLIYVAQHEMRCPHKVEDKGPGNLIRRCALDKDHPGECDPLGKDARDTTV